ncbi:flagella synthesis protein FlgN [Marinobacter sp. DUT-3]|uniref:flagella synthesis protein FlgN n=1 Tax=unclassified Marinobacter TaxID=83889 RepID=UPI00387A865E
MAAIDELKDLLSQDIRQLDALADILEQEKSCLSSSDMQALQAITTEKNTLLDQIRGRARQKIHTLVAMGYRPESGAPSRFIRSAGLSDLASLWSQANERLTFCQEINQNNGRVISHMQKRLSRLTDIFRGASSQQKLYGAHGEQTGASQRTILASA